MGSNYNIRLLGVNDVDAFVSHCQIHDRESGAEGDLPYGPCSRHQISPPSEMREKALRRWNTELGKTGWRRVWGLWHGERVVGHILLAGGELEAALHRVHLGIGIERPHRNLGWGRKLLEVAIHWATEQPTIDWIDLGVFEGNQSALSLYRRLEFEQCGRVDDLFRVDGIHINNIQMVRYVGRTGAPSRSPLS